jgi:hypothetical protein
MAIYSNTVYCMALPWFNLLFDMWHTPRPQKPHIYLLYIVVYPAIDINTRIILLTIEYI